MFFILFFHESHISTLFPHNLVIFLLHNFDLIYFDERAFYSLFAGIRVFYSSLLRDLAFGWQRGWRWSCFDTVEQLDLHYKSEVFIITRSPPASLPFKGQGPVSRKTR